MIAICRTHVSHPPFRGVGCTLAASRGKVFSAQMHVLPTLPFPIAAGIKKCPILSFVALATRLEIIYKTCNHASGRREYHPCAEHKVFCLTCGQRKWPYPHPDVHKVHRRSHDCVGYQKRGLSCLNLLTVSIVGPRFPSVERTTSTTACRRLRQTACPAYRSSPIR